MNTTVKITLGIIGCAVYASINVCVGIVADKLSVVETKSFSVTATIDAHDYRPPYTTYTLHYTVDFEGETYKDNQENVGAGYYNRHKDGDKVAAVFERQWRADGSGTNDT